MKDLWVPEIYIANNPHAQLINNKDDMSKHVLGNDFSRKKLFLSPLKASMSHMKWRWEIEIRTNKRRWREESHSKTWMHENSNSLYIVPQHFQNNFPFKTITFKMSIWTKKPAKTDCTINMYNGQFKKAGVSSSTFSTVTSKKLHT